MKSIALSIVITAVLIGGAIMLATGGGGGGGAASTSNVTDENGTQVIAVDVKGDYQPRVTQAKAGVDSVLRMKTNGTYSCALGLKVAAIGFQQYLQPSGTTDIPVPPQQAGTSIQGMCSMGMYNFEIKFI